MSLSWNFNPIKILSGMITENPYNSSLNSEDYGINTTIGREAIQNALDARLDKNKPVKLVFTWREFSEDEFFIQYLDGLTKRLERMEGGIKVDENYKFNPSFLIIEDFNTKGLTGKYNTSNKEEKERRLNTEEKNNFISYFFKLGISEKKGTEGGRRGTGRSTFNIASSLRTQFVISKRSDDNNKIFLGLCLGKSHFLDNDDSEYEGIGYYSELNEKGQIQPSVNSTDVEKLAKKINIFRKDEPGTSFIIPYPIKKLQFTTIITKCLDSYFTVINNGQLELQFNYGDTSEIINSSNLNEKLIHYNLNTEADFLKFIDSCRQLGENKIVKLRDESAQDGIIDKYDFFDSQKELSELRADYLNNKTIGLKVPVSFQKIGDDKIYKSYFKIFISKTLHTQGKVMFVRGNMALIGEGQKNFPKNCFGYFIAEEDNIVTLIADSEGINHTVIEPTHSTITDKYADATHLILLTMKKSLANFAALILNPDEEDDNTSLAAYFPVNKDSDILNPEESEDEFDEIDATGDSDTSTKKDDDDTDFNKGLEKIKGQEPTFIIKPLASEIGFRVIANKQKPSISEFFPKKIKIKVAYAEPGKNNSITSYEPLDFDFDKQKTLIFNLEKVKIIQKQKNILEVEALDETFLIEVSNFFELYGLEVSIV